MIKMKCKEARNKKLFTTRDEVITAVVQNTHVVSDVMCRWASGSRRFEGTNRNFRNHSPKDTALDPIKPEPKNICKLRYMHNATMTRSRTSTCLRNRNNYRKSEESEKCVVHFSIHSSAKRISMRHIFIVSAIQTRRNVFRPSSRECDILARL
jgi:hypothetical protein